MSTVEAPPPSRYGSTPAAVRVGRALDAVSALSNLGARRVLLVTDAGLRATGVPEQLAQGLRAAGVAVAVHAEVQPDPTGEAVAAAHHEFVAHEADALLALGGGSVLDTAKAVGFLAARGGPMEGHVGFADDDVAHPPLVAVPTTAGTGSEAQSFALISRTSDHRKLACGARGAMPRAAILDPVLVAGAPRSVRATAGLDALAHAVETRVTTAGTSASRAHAHAAFLRVFGAYRRFLDDPHATGAARAMAEGASMAGQAIEASMLGAAHAAANPLSAHHGVAHGLAVGRLLPHVVRLNAVLSEAAAEAYAALAADAGLRPHAQALADALDALLEASGTPTLAEAAPEALAALDALAADATTQWTGGFNPAPLDAAAFAGLYEAALRA